jgi:hypothetical protein
MQVPSICTTTHVGCDSTSGATGRLAMSVEKCSGDIPGQYCSVGLLEVSILARAEFLNKTAKQSFKYFSIHSDTVS